MLLTLIPATNYLPAESDRNQPSSAARNAVFQQRFQSQQYARRHQPTDSTASIFLGCSVV